MLGVRQLAVVSPAWPEGEEQGQWDIGDSSMPDATPVNLGTVLRLMDDIRRGQSDMAVRLQQSHERLEEDEDKRHALHELRSEKNEKVLEQISKRLGELEANKRDAQTAFTVLRWLMYIFGGSVIAGLGLAWNIITGNAQLMTTLSASRAERTQQFEQIQQGVQGLRQDITPSGPPK